MKNSYLYALNMHRLSCSLIISFVLIFLLTMTAHAQIAQKPLFLTSSVDPNIMFILDDSGSMMWEVTPDDTIFWNVLGSVGGGWGDWLRVNGFLGGACDGAGNCDYYRQGTGFVLNVFPRVANIYGPTDYPAWYSNVATVEGMALADANWPAYTALMRSSQTNATFYDPSITYSPWSFPDGSLYPVADPTCALHNPMNAGLGCRVLNSEITVRERWAECQQDSNVTNQCTRTFNERTFWPATYFSYTGPDYSSLIGDAEVWDTSNYERVFIRATTPNYSGHGRDKRTDCTAGVCTYAQEIQNFAHWYTYHRSRILASRGGIGKAFSDQQSNLRVGFGTINAATSSVDGVDAQTVIDGVRKFEGSSRTSFFNQLYTHPIPAQGTPLRRALDDAGQYFSRSDNQGPWSTTPGASGGTDLVCRQSYTILMTDGYWNSDAANVATGNVDGSSGPLITGPGGQTFQYLTSAASPAHPFHDTHPDTLADVAMHYWNRDLRPDLENRVPISLINPAFWQHMVTFGVGLGVAGQQDPGAAFDAIGPGTNLGWTAPFDGGTWQNIDDLLHAGVNSRGGFFSARDPNAFATELSNTLTSIMARGPSSAAAIATNSTRLVDGSLIYQARFDSNDWSGELRAYPIQMDGSVIYTPAEWATYFSARFPTLTVPPYPGWSTSDTGKIPPHGTRNVFTWNGSAGLDFTVAEWGNLSVSQKSALIDGDVDGVGDPDVDAGKARLNWLRGENISGMRNRSVTLGDIVNSDPLVVGVPNFRYELLPAAAAGQSTYQTYRADNFNRKRVLYVGANDGMLHAFDANRIDTTNTDGGSELFAYLPAGAYEHLADLTDPDYSHRYFVDGSPIVGDAYVDLYGTGAQWRTILIGTLGAGGRSVFALDVSDPENFSADNVLWEFTDPDLGYTFGQPALARMANGNWAVVFGNGYGSDNHKAMLFIVNAEDGTLIKKIDTGIGTAAAKNGLSTPALLPNSQRTITTAYAGDLQGNLWKFNLDHTNTGNWQIPFVTNPGAINRPLFTAINDANQVQPITAPIEIGVPPTGQSGYMVYFGTGKYFESGDNDVSVPATNPGIQSFYGIWDNGSRITVTDRSNANFPLVEQEIQAEVTVTAEDGTISNVETIVSRELEANETNYRIVSQNSVAYPGKRGWYIDLVSPEFGQQGERVVSSPLLRRGRIIFTTLIPMDDPCSTGGTSWLMELDATTGARLSKAVFDVDQDKSVGLGDTIAYDLGAGVIDIDLSGRQSNVGIIKTPAVIEAGAVEYKYFGGSDGDIEVVREMGGEEDEFGRRSWRQLQ